MARMYEAECLRDCVQDVPYQYFRKGDVYSIPEDSPVAKHFKPRQELSRKESERIEEETREQGPPPGRPAVPVPERQGGVRVTVPAKPKNLGKK